jgi:hypothetical protein
MALGGRGQLEYPAEFVGAAETHRSIEIALRIRHQTAIGSGAIGLALESVKNGFLPDGLTGGDNSNTTPTLDFPP